MSRNQTLSPLPVPAHTTRINDADEQIRQAAPPVQRSGVCTDRVTGAKHVQQFRRTYFTAEWTDSVLVEVRVWGPRVLRDGSLGERELDYRSKNARATRGRSIRSGPARRRPAPAGPASVGSGDGHLSSRHAPKAYSSPPDPGALGD